MWTTSLRADLTSQINFANLVKAGIEVAYSNLDLRYDQINFFVGGRNSVRQKNDPIRGAIYIQDKLEAKGFILSGGLRLDYTNSNMEWVDVSVFDRSYYSTDYKPAIQYSMKKTKGQWSLSPRLSISHPISENSKLFFNYGHFKQLPSYEQMFRIGRGNTGQASNIGDPNLILAKTISYELGYDQALFNNYLIQLAAYYHDIQDQQTYIKYISSDSRANYTKATNQSYADIRGFELTLRKNTGRWWTAFANYTYEVTTSGIFGYTFVYESIPMQVDWFRQNRGNLQQQRPQPAPYARVDLALHTPSGFGPEWLGMKPLQDWAMTLIGEWRSGGYFTWNENNLPGVSQNVQLTSFTNFTLRLNKTLDLKKFKVTFFMEVENLFNTKYLSGAGFYDALDQTAYLQSLHLPKSKAYKNIVGTDKIGAYRKCTEFQPMSQFQSIDAYQGTPDPLVFYYEMSTKRYLQFANDAWGEVDKGRINKVLDDKAYIDMPNQTSFNFLNPRQIFFGIRTSFDLR